MRRSLCSSLFLIFILLVFLASCAFSSRNNDIDNLTDRDFIPPTPKVFSRSKDFLDEKFGDSGVLRGESMHKAVARGLSYFDGADDPLDRALSLCYRKDFSKADNVFRNLYRAYKKHPVYWNQVGTCELIRGNRRKALLFYNKSKDLSSRYAPPLNNLGVLYQLDGKDQKALAAYKRASRISSFSLTPLLNLGQLYARYGFIRKAKKIFNSLYKRDKNDFDVLSALGYLHLIDGNYKTAVNIYSRIDKEVYKSARVGVNLAMALYLSGRKKDAMGIWGNIRSPDDREERRYYERAESFFRNKL